MKKKNRKNRLYKSELALLPFRDCSAVTARQYDFLQNYGVLCNSCNLCEDWMASGIGWRHDIEMRSN